MSSSPWGTATGLQEADQSPLSATVCPSGRLSILLRHKIEVCCLARGKQANNIATVIEEKANEWIGVQVNPSFVCVWGLLLSIVEGLLVWLRSPSRVTPQVMNSAMRFNVAHKG